MQLSLFILARTCSARPWRQHSLAPTTATMLIESLRHLPDVKRMRHQRKVCYQSSNGTINQSIEESVHDQAIFTRMPFGVVKLISSRKLDTRLMPLYLVDYSTFYSRSTPTGSFSVFLPLEKFRALFTFRDLETLLYSPLATLPHPLQTLCWHW
jgi:hypothetical protein